MVERQKSTDTSTSRRWILLAVIIAPLTIAGVLITLFTVTVQADTPIAPPDSTLVHATAPEALAPKPPAIWLDFTNPIAELRGIASWYGGNFDGQKTASGERYDMHALTACANSLPFQSVVRVVNLRNRRSVVVRINDRGLLFPGRIIDLSFAAAEQLDMMHSGLAPVKLDVLWMGSRRAAK